MEADPQIATLPDVNHAEQSALAAQVAKMVTGLRALPLNRMKHRRAGVTKNKMQKRDKGRAKMARESRRRNRG